MASIQIKTTKGDARTVSLAAMRIVRGGAADEGTAVPQVSIAAIHDAWQDIMVMIALAGQGPAMIDFPRESDVPAKFDSFLAYCHASVGDGGRDPAAPASIASRRLCVIRAEAGFRIRLAGSERSG